MGGLLRRKKYSQQGEGCAQHRDNDRSEDEALGSDSGQVLALDDKSKFTHTLSVQ
jgi:hypothetical protein